MKRYGVAVSFFAALSVHAGAIAQTSNLTKQEIHEVGRGGLGSFPPDPREADAVARQLEALKAKGQQVIWCHYGVPGQIYSYLFWHKSAPDGIRQILKSLRGGQDHPFWTLGVNAVEACPATREAARKLLADSRAGVESAPPRSAAAARAAATLLKAPPPKIKDVPPVYPKEWQRVVEAARERGSTINASLAIDVTIGADGRVTDAVIDSGASVGPQALLGESAFAAIRQWVYDVRGLKPPVKFRVTVPFGTSTPR